ncbi:MAG: translation elongation factor Ts [Turicibacter sp.]|nr:translation elongation factor Ts [Turicibacter sp.]
MAVTATMVKELREKTGAGMMDCKKALVETAGDMEAAVKFLREKGMAKAAKKADRVAAEGLTDIFVDGNEATIIEINSETDFVAKNSQFIELVQETAKLIAKHKPANNEEALAIKNEKGQTLEDALLEATTVIGEKISFRRFEVITKTDAQVFGAYKHAGSRISVVTVVEGADETTAKQISMHIASMKPTHLSYTELDQAFVDSEVAAKRAEIEKENEERQRLKNPDKPILPVPQFVSRLQLTEEAMAEVKAKLEAELKAEGKPEKIWDKIIPGKLERFIKDNTDIDRTYTLLAQDYVLDDSKTVEKHLNDINASVISFTRFEVGEGIEKIVTDFAAEVAAQVAGN